MWDAGAAVDQAVQSSLDVAEKATAVHNQGTKAHGIEIAKPIDMVSCTSWSTASFAF